jgi:hypothetical protein
MPTPYWSDFCRPCYYLIDAIFWIVLRPAKININYYLLFFIEITSIFNNRSNISAGFIKMTVAKLIQAYTKKKRAEAKLGDRNEATVSTGKLEPAQTAGTSTNGTK